MCNINVQNKGGGGGAKDRLKKIEKNALWVEDGVSKDVRQ